MPGQAPLSERATHRRGRWSVVGLSLVTAGLLASACGSSGGGATMHDSSSGTTSGASTGSTGATPAAAGLMVRQTRLGLILTDGAGRTVYLFEKDKGSTSSCFGACAAQWPPVTTAGAQPTVTGGDPTLVSTTKRRGGTMQLTYHGHALYYFADDHRPGDTNGQGLKTFGGGWDVLSASGQKIEGGS